MKILGIETSCDETAASVVENGRTILSNVVASSLRDHKKYGGIVPEIASRRQIELIDSVVEKSLTDAHLKLDDIDRIAVTKSPGLIGSLLVGTSFARALSYATQKPLVEVDHIKAHLYANFISDKKSFHHNGHLPKIPAIGLVVSGGHSSLFHVKHFDKFDLLGQTRDDAAGEAFDKVARILGLGYPGGPIIDKLARTGKNNEIRFRCANLPDSFDFSFSGIKTAVLYYTRDNQKKKNFSLNKLAYSFQNSIVNVLADKCVALCLKKKIKTLVVGGGVAANSALRKQLISEGNKHDIKVYFPPLKLCLDNAAMIAGLGFHLKTK